MIVHNDPKHFSNHILYKYFKGSKNNDIYYLVNHRLFIIIMKEKIKNHF